MKRRENERTGFNQRQKEMEAYEAQSKSTENAGSLRKRGKKVGIGGMNEKNS